DVHDGEWRVARLDDGRRRSPLRENRDSLVDVHKAEAPGATEFFARLVARGAVAIQIAVDACFDDDSVPVAGVADCPTDRPALLCGIAAGVGVAAVVPDA